MAEEREVQLVECLVNCFKLKPGRIPLHSAQSINKKASLLSFKKNFLGWRRLCVLLELVFDMKAQNVKWRPMFFQFTKKPFELLMLLQLKRT